ncbi:MAG: tRNA (N(6)-L-threonylcarbamoyladenosine(37)-C(2))-methylthiotransferase MtaB [Anaerolineae bacterium]|nr:tRNA (N(6)-L-threonylcarbamoyladenosine(37)-C(2))-methylthiotransferase MtaB [Anaerolineae bacterium]
MNVHLRMLGCRLNQAEIERMGRQLAAQGHTVVDDVTQADQIIVNTCAVTHDAVRGSRKLVRQMHRTNDSAAITVTGCYAQLEPEALRTLPGVTRVVDNQEKDRLVETLTGQPLPDYDIEPVSRHLRAVSGGRTRAFVKVQDGCDNACTFCVTTVARGAGRSRTVADVLDEIRLLLAMGYQEVVLTGVHLGSYGHDLGDAQGLLHLVQAIFAETDVPRLRLSSLEPWDLTPEFFDLWQDPRLCRHLHLPLQSGCDATLRRMARRTNQAQFSALVQEARQRSPEVCITTDVIVGFPGETDEEFETSFAFIESMDFAGLHVFRYSKRPGTAAARMRGHVAEAVSRERSTRLMAYADAQARRYAERFAGQALDVLWEQVAGATERGFVNIGYTDNYIRVRCIHPRALTNHIIRAQLDAYDVERQQMRGIAILD